MKDVKWWEFLTASAFSMTQEAKSPVESEQEQWLMVEADRDTGRCETVFHWQIHCPSQVCSQARWGDLYVLCTVQLAIDFAFQSLSLP